MDNQTNTCEMTLNEFITKTTETAGNPRFGFCFRPPIFCNDGFRMSVQGSNGHYCTPRILAGSYSEMEIGYPSEAEPEILKYAEDSANPTDTVYPYVPVEIIQSVINKHGGIDIEKTFEHE